MEQIRFSRGGHEAVVEVVFSDQIGDAIVLGKTEGAGTVILRYEDEGIPAKVEQSELFQKMPLANGRR